MGFCYVFVQIYKSCSWWKKIIYLFIIISLHFLGVKEKELMIIFAYEERNMIKQLRKSDVLMK